MADQKGKKMKCEEYIKELNRLERVLEKECPKYEDDCKKCPYSQECDKYAHLEEMYK